MSDETFGRTFVGDVYIRPLGRGVCLGLDMIDFEDWLTEAIGVPSVSAGGETVRVRITVERIDAPPATGPAEGA